MKLFTITALFLMGTVASANCPELSGKFTCPTEEGDLAVEVSQTVDNGVTTYLIVAGQDHLIFPADNVEQTFEDKSQGIKGKMRVACESNALKVFQSVAAVDMSGAELESVDQVDSFTRDAAKALVVSTTGTHKADGVETPYNYSMTCAAR